MSEKTLQPPYKGSMAENPLLGAAFLLWGSPRIKKRQDRGARRAGWVDLRNWHKSTQFAYPLKARRWVARYLGIEFAPISDISLFVAQA
jgi:hypothetical protein